MSTSAGVSQASADSKGEVFPVLLDDKTRAMLTVCLENLEQMEDDTPRRKRGIRSRRYKDGKHMLVHWWEKIRPGDVIEFAMKMGLKHYGIVVAKRFNQEKKGQRKAMEVYICGKFGGPHSPSWSIKNGFIKLEKLYDIRSKCRLNTLIDNELQGRGIKMREVKESVRMALADVGKPLVYDVLKSNCGAWTNECRFVNFKDSLQADWIKRFQYTQTLKNIYP